MAKTESTFLNMLVVLTVITLIAGAALGYVYGLPKDLLPMQKKTTDRGCQMVAPEFDNFPD